MFNILALDWGEKRFGMAFGDPITELILTANYECNTKNIFYILANEITQRKIEILVVGIPTSFQGNNTIVSNKIYTFIQDLKLIYPGLQIDTINERYTTKQAKTIIGDNKNKHTLNHQAAAKILEYYFHNQN